MQSSVPWAVKKALLNAGVKRGIVAPIEYMGDNNREDFSILSQSRDIFKCHLIKSKVFEYEKEVRFVFSARRDVLRDRGGLLLDFMNADFFTHQTSPYLQREEIGAIDMLISNLSPED